MKSQKCEKAKALMSQALGIISTMGDREIVKEARQHVKKAINNLELIESNQIQKKEKDATISQEWWGNIVAGTVKMANSNMSSDSTKRMFEKLDSLIDLEKKKIEELDNKNINKIKPNQILHD